MHLPRPTKLRNWKMPLTRLKERYLKELYVSYKNSDIDILTLIELKSTVLRLGNIADRAENASDRVPIIVAKRKG